MQKDKLWDEKSQNYPRYSSKKDLVFEREILDFAMQNGVNFKDKSVLDIGCGSGVYTILMAKMAKNVLGIDISKDMLDILKVDANEQNLDNIDTKLCDFNEFNSKFDVVTSFMSPALFDEKNIQKAYDLANESLVILGWAGLRDSRLLNKTFKIHNSEYTIPNSFEKFKSVLSDKISNYKIHNTTWIREYESLDLLIKEQIWHLKMRGITPNLELLKDAYKNEFQDGYFIEKTDVRLGVIICKK